MQGGCSTGPENHSAGFRGMSRKKRARQPPPLPHADFISGVFPRWVRPVRGVALAGVVRGRSRGGVLGGPHIEGLAGGLAKERDFVSAVWRPWRDTRDRGG